MQSDGVRLLGGGRLYGAGPGGRGEGAMGSGAPLSRR